MYKGLPSLTPENTVTGTDFINLCPHTVVVMARNWNKPVGERLYWVEYPAPRTAARAVGIDNSDRLPLMRQTDMGVNLREPTTGVAKVEGIQDKPEANIIVSLEVALVLVKLGTHRGMIVSPDISNGSAIRDKHGKLLACLGFDWHNWHNFK